MHKVVQQRFFDLITSQEPLFMSKANPIETYKELIHYRFKEVILMAFPRFCEYLSEEEINQYIVDFIISAPKTPYIWQMPNEFRTFLCKQTDILKRFAFADDLLWFEWIEIEVFMRNFSRQKIKPFSWSSSLKLSDSTVLQKLDYAAFDNTRLQTNADYFVLLYYNFETHEVHFQELTEFLYRFLEHLETHTLTQTLETFSAQFEASVQDIQEILEPTLIHFCEQEILHTK